MIDYRQHQKQFRTAISQIMAPLNLSAEELETWYQSIINTTVSIFVVTFLKMHNPNIDLKSINPSDTLQIQQLFAKTKNDSVLLKEKVLIKSFKHALQLAVNSLPSQQQSLVTRYL